MTTEVLLDELARRGVIIKPDGDGLLVDAPKGAVDDALRRELTERKPELLQWLSEVVCPRWQVWQEGRGDLPPLSTCLSCGYPDMPGEVVTIDGESWQRWSCPRCGKGWRVPLSDEPLPPCPRCGGVMDGREPPHNPHAQVTPILRLTCLECELVACAYPPGTWAACWRCDSGLERRQVSDDWTAARCLRCGWMTYEPGGVDGV